MDRKLAWFVSIVLSVFVCFPWPKRFILTGYHEMFCNSGVLRLQYLCYFSICIRRKFRFNQISLVNMHALSSDTSYLKFINSYIFESIFLSCVLKYDSGNQNCIFVEHFLTLPYQTLAKLALKFMANWSSYVNTSVQLLRNKCLKDSYG